MCQYELATEWDHWDTSLQIISSIDFWFHINGSQVLWGKMPPGYLISSIGWGWGGGCRGRSCLSIILRIGSCRGCRVGGRGILQSLRLLELLPVGVRPAKGGGGPGEAGHGSLHLDPGEGGAGHGGHQAEAGVHFVLFPLPGLDIVLLQCNWSRLAVNLLIKSTSVTNNVSSCKYWTIRLHCESFNRWPCH